MLEKLPVELGDALRSHRAGMEGIAYHRLLAARPVTTMQISSLAFANAHAIPPRYTADGPGISPPLEWSGVPEGTDSLVLIVEDSDSPTPHPLVHAIAINLDASRRSLPESALNGSNDKEPADIDFGINSLLMRGWLPPDPPPGHGQHRYAFQLFALGTGAALPNGAGRHQVFEAISERALAAGCLLGTYERPRPIANDDSTSEELDFVAADPITPVVS